MCKLHVPDDDIIHEVLVSTMLPYARVTASLSQLPVRRHSSAQVSELPKLPN